MLTLKVLNVGQFHIVISNFGGHFKKILVTWEVIQEGKNTSANQNGAVKHELNYLSAHLYKYETT